MQNAKKKIIVAEDDPAIVDAIQMMLEDAGYIVETTSDAQIANLIKEELPSLLLLDVWMSGHDGREICAYLKKQKHTKNIPIIMVSATRDLEASAIKAGAEDFIEKPFEMNELLDKVAKWSVSE